MNSRRFIAQCLPCFRSGRSFKLFDHALRRQKLPEISPILKADTVSLQVSREKDKEIALGRCRMGTIRRSFSRTAAGKLAGGGRVDPTPWHGKPPPPVKNRDPPGTPFFYPAIAAAYVHRT